MTNLEGIIGLFHAFLIGKSRLIEKAKTLDMNGIGITQNKNAVFLRQGIDQFQLLVGNIFQKLGPCIFHVDIFAIEMKLFAYASAESRQIDIAVFECAENTHMPVCRQVIFDIRNAQSRQFVHTCLLIEIHQHAAKIENNVLDAA